MSNILQRIGTDKLTNLRLNSRHAVFCDIRDSGNVHAVEVKPRAKRTVRTRTVHHGHVRFESVSEHIRTFECSEYITCVSLFLCQLNVFTLEFHNSLSRTDPTTSSGVQLQISARRIHFTGVVMLFVLMPLIIQHKTSHILQTNYIFISTHTF